MHIVFRHFSPYFLVMSVFQFLVSFNILSRLEILRIMNYLTTQDMVDPVVDEQLALFVVNSHIRSHPDLKNGVAEEEREVVKDGLAREIGNRLIYFG